MIPLRQIAESNSPSHAEGFAEALSAMAVAIIRRNDSALEDARQEFARVWMQTTKVAAAASAIEVLKVAAKAGAKSPPAMEFALGQPSMVFAGLASVDPEDAIVEIATRVPVTVKNAAERTRQRISELYSEGRAFAAVHSAEQVVTENVQRIVTNAIAKGTNEVDVAREIVAQVDKVRELTNPWTTAYAQTVFRTNMTTAVTAARFQTARDPDVRAVVPAFRFQTAQDNDVRNNHGALNRMVFAVDNPIWTRIAPPLGYKCRCWIAMVTRPQLRREGRLKQDGSVREDRVPKGAGPDEGFRPGPRPDLGIPVSDNAT